MAGWKEFERTGLNPTQQKVVVTLLANAERSWTLTGLAKELSVSKASVCDTVSSLEKKGLLKKHRIESDGRSAKIILTPSGAFIAQSISGYPDAILSQIELLSSEQKAGLLDGLVNCIFLMQQAGFIPYTRMCLSCTHFTKKEQTPHCNLMKQHLKKTDLRVDCPEHVLRGF